MGRLEAVFKKAAEFACGLSEDMYGTAVEMRGFLKSLKTSIDGMVADP